MNNDPFLAGLDTESSPGPQEAPDSDTVNEFLEKLHNQAEPALAESAGADEESTSDAASLSVDSVDIPPGAILALTDVPFTDFDAAQYKAKQISAETGESFYVRAISDKSFVVMADPSHSATATTSLPTDEDLEDEIDPLDIPVEDLKLSDFPEDHAIHNFSIALYKRVLKKGYKLRESYRSMWLLVSLIPIGALIYFFPIAALNLLPQAMLVEIVKNWTPEQMAWAVSKFGMGAAIFSGGYVLYRRMDRRFMFMPAFVKCETGILKRHSTKTTYGNIVNYDVNQGIVARLFNYGTLELSSAGSDGAEIFVTNVYAPRLVELALERRIDESRKALYRR